MIIVNQSKDELVNFDNILNVYITISEDYKECYIKYEDCNNSYRELGKYKKLERAKEVLKDIWKFYEILKRYECSSNNVITIFLEPKFAYQMPEE